MATSFVRKVEHSVPRILVVEDESVVASLLADVLRAAGMQVAVALSGKAGLALAERDVFDVVICDLQMPGMDGLSFFQALEQREHPLRERALFVTGDAQGAEKREFLRRHELTCLSKPFRMRELLR